MSLIVKLPSEIFHQILSFIEPSHQLLSSLDLTCKTFTEFTKLCWKDLLYKNFINFYDENQELKTKYLQLLNNNLEDKTCYGLINILIKKEINKTQHVKKKGYYKQAPDWNVAVMGLGGSGKSACTIRFVQGLYLEEYDPTIEDSYRKKLTANDNYECTMDILDTAGPEDYFALRAQAIRSCDGFVLLCAMDDLSSLRELESYIENIHTVKESTTTPCVFIVNKCDLENELKTNNIDRMITKEIVENMLNKKIKEGHLKRIMPILFTSAKDNININETFYGILKEIRTNRVDFEKIIDKIIANQNNFKAILMDEDDTAREKKKCFVM
ncbi:hypothetical protein ABK040_005880 [Willaertia magna]